MSGFTFWRYIHGSKVVIIDNDTDVGGVGIGVRETATRDEGVDRWTVRGFSEPFHF